MTQKAFGSGVLWGRPLYDASGNAIANPTPIKFGTLQDVSLDISWDIKQLYGQNQFPEEVARGKGKIGGKAKSANINGLMMNSIIFGQTLAASILSDVYDQTGQLIPATPFTITTTPPSTGTYAKDLGVINANGDPMVRVAATPATGQYSVNESTGVYTFAAADTGLKVFINYQYTATSTTASRIDVTNLLMGYAPSFSIDLYLPYKGKSLIVQLPNVISNKLSMATKLDDFMVPEFDFEAFADSTGRVITVAMTN